MSLVKDVCWPRLSSPWPADCLLPARRLQCFRGVCAEFMKSQTARRHSFVHSLAVCLGANRRLAAAMATGS